MKRFLIGGMLVLLMFVCTPTSARAATLAELQAMIAKLTAQLNAMSVKPVNQPIVIINPSATSTGYISFVERPTLKLIYDKNKSESSLEAVANVYMEAGAKDLLVNYMAVVISDANGKQVYTNKRTAQFTGVSNTKKELVPSTYGSSNEAWRVKAGTKAIFKIKLIENPQAMFAGTYTASLGSVGILDKDGVVAYDQLAYTNMKSFEVTIVGEKSPYLSGSDFKGDQVMISGVRFARGDKVYVNGVKKGVLTDVSKLNNNLVNGAFPISWLDKSEKGGCALYGNIQIENARYGKSNSFYVSKGCDDTGGTLSAKSMELMGESKYYQPGQSIKFSVKGISSDGKQASPSKGFHVQSSIKQPSQTTKWEPVTVNGVVQSVNAEFNYSTGYWDVTMTAPSDTSVLYTVDTAFYCSMSSSGCVDGSQVDQSFTFKIGNPTTPSVQAAANQLTKAVLDLAYNSSRAEIALNANQQFTVMTGADDVYVIWANMKINRVGGETVVPRGGWIPNGASFSVTGLSNTAQKNFTDTYGNNQTGWLVKAGQKAIFIAKSGMNPQLMYSGIYNAEIGNVGIYSNGNYGSVVWKGDSMPSVPVTIVGEKTTGSETTDLRSCSSNPTYTFTRDLTIGSSGDDVVYLKCFLNAKGYLLGNYVNNYFGPMAKAALAAYQASKGISPADGYFGPATRANVNADMVVTPVISPSITVLYPNGGEILTLAKDTFLVTFKPLIGKINSVELLSSDGNVYNLGSFVGESTDKQAVNIDTVYMGKLGVKNGSYKVRVCLNLSDQYDSLCDTSDNYFTITNPVVIQPSITVLSPNGRETMITGGLQEIKWTSSGIPTGNSLQIPPNLSSGSNMMIDLIDSRGYTVSTIASSSTYPVTANDGEESWTIPVNIKSGQYKIQITCQTCGSVNGGNGLQDLSDNYFRILQAPTPVEARTSQINSIAAALQAIKEMLKSL